MKSISFIRAIPQYAGLLAATGIFLSQTSLAQSPGLEEIRILGIREDRQSEGATGLSLSAFETPQSVSVLGSELIDDFGLDDINTALHMATGVNVEEAETDRTYYNARGFDITSMHVDGVGIPFEGLVHGSLDTAIYEQVEVIRGANGLITGIGNPSGTVNYVRKRPTNEFLADLEMSVGSWNKKRVAADVSTPLTEDGRWAARTVIAYEDTDSCLDLYQNTRETAYGIIDGQIGDNLTLAIGHTYQNSHSDGVLWGALPLLYSDGSQADLDVSNSTTMDWTYWTAQTNTSFLELGYQLPNSWELTSTVTYTDYSEPSELFYVYGSADPETGLGIQGWPGKFHTTSESLQWDTKLSGDFQAFNQNHEIVFGLSLADKEQKSDDTTALTGFEAMPGFPGWDGTEIARPTWGETVLAADMDIKLNRLFAAMRLSLSDELKLILGMNAVEYENTGVSWGVSTDSSEKGNSPYVGFTWEVAEGLNAYASYSDIYQPQYELGDDFQPLGSAKGESYEAGLKKRWLDDSLMTTVALFKTEQENLAEFAGYSDGDNIDDTDFSDDFDWALYRGISVEAEGVELEIAGRISDSLTLETGYTQLKMKDPGGNDARTFIPRKTLKILARWQPVALEGLELGFSTRWQDDIQNSGLEQSAHAILGAYVSYAVTEKLDVSLKGDNLSDKKHLTSLQWNQSYYGAPRSVTVSMNYGF
ncbi:MAG: TonB-dependent siderophore receptor [Pseudomonadales bacterium]